MSKPKVSVIMPVYNTEKYVEEAINSILNQTFRDFEFIIIDDASTDKSVEIVKGFKDERIKLITKPFNTGYTDSLNKGLELANGKYIARMDSDDISLPTRLEKQVKFLDNNPDVILCGTWFELLNKEKSIFNYPTNPEEVKATLLNYCSIGHPTVMFRKEIFNTHGLSYDKSMEPAEDYNLWVDISSIGKLANIGEVLFQYRTHQNQVSNKRAEQQKLNSQIARFKMLSNLNHGLELESIFPESTKPISQKQLENVFLNLMKLEKINSENKVFETKLFENSLNAFRREIAFEYFMIEKNYNITSFFLLLKTSAYRRCFEKKTLIKLYIKCLINYKSETVSYQN
ncbi:putative glycosyltransferase EpsE [compost metagenome]